MSGPSKLGRTGRARTERGPAVSTGCVIPLHPSATRGRAALVLGHAVRAQALARVGDADLARGAALVAAVEAIRLAVTPVGSAEDHAFKATFLRGFVARVDPVRRVRIARLVDVALEGEADRRRLGGLRVAGDDEPTGGEWIPPSPVPVEAVPGIVGRHLEASRLDADLDLALRLARSGISEMGDQARRGRSTEGARRALADLAFALCLNADASADDADLRLGLLDILLDSQREGEPSRDVIRAGVALERARWGGAVAGRA